MENIIIYEIYVRRDFLTRANIMNIQIKFLSRDIIFACDRNIKSVRHLIEERTV